MYVSRTCGGAADEHKSIKIDGKLFSVHQNLYCFLRTAIRSHSEEWLWIDALCIDQGNLNERNHQVGMMGSIYAQARKTLVYGSLGDRHIEYGLCDADSWTRSLASSLEKSVPQNCEHVFPAVLWTVCGRNTSQASQHYVNYHSGIELG